jgi:hypothetical protein
MSINDIIDYILSTPENSNPNVLKGMIELMLTSLAGLEDVNIINPEDGQILMFDANSNKWINTNIYDQIIIT